MTEMFTYSEYDEYSTLSEANKQPCRYGELPLLAGKYNFEQSLRNCEPKGSPFTQQKSATKKSSKELSRQSLSDAEKQKPISEYAQEPFRQSLSDAEGQKSHHQEIQRLMKQYTRISPEFFALLQQKGKPLERNTVVKPSKVQVPQFALKYDPTALDHTNPQLAAYLRTVMELGGISNTLFGVDFYNNYADTSQDVNPEQVLHLLRQLEASGALSPDQLQALVDAFGALNPDNLARLLEFLQAAGALTPVMRTFLQQLMQQSGDDLIPKQLAMVLDSLERSKRAPHRNSAGSLGDAKVAGGNLSANNSADDLDGSGPRGGTDRAKKTQSKIGYERSGMYGVALGSDSSHAAFIKFKPKAGYESGINKWDAVILRDGDLITDRNQSVSTAGGNKRKRAYGMHDAAGAAAGTTSRRDGEKQVNENPDPAVAAPGDESKMGGGMHGRANSDSDVDGKSKKSGKTHSRGNRGSTGASPDDDRSKKSGGTRGRENRIETGADKLKEQGAATVDKSSKKRGGVDDRGNRGFLDGADVASKGVGTHSGGSRDSVSSDADKSKEAGGSSSRGKRWSLATPGADRIKNAGAINSSGIHGYKNFAAGAAGAAGGGGGGGGGGGAQGAADGGNDKKKKGDGKYIGGNRGDLTAASADKSKKAGRFDRSGNRNTLSTTADDDRAHQGRGINGIENRGATGAAENGMNAHENVESTKMATAGVAGGDEAATTANDGVSKKKRGSVTADNKNKKRRLLNATGNKLGPNRNIFRPDSKRSAHFSHLYPSADSMEVSDKTLSKIDTREGFQNRKRVKLRSFISPPVQISSRGKKHPLYYEPWDVDNFYADLDKFTHLAKTARKKRVPRHSDMDYMEINRSKLRPRTETLEVEDQEAPKLKTGKSDKKPKKQK